MESLVFQELKQNKRKANETPYNIYGTARNSSGSLSYDYCAVTSGTSALGDTLDTIST